MQDMPVGRHPFDPGGPACAIMPCMSKHWPDQLTRPATEQVTALLTDFWSLLSELPDLVARGENLLCAERLGKTRRVLMELVLALNGIARPQGTQDLNVYLSVRQRQALERTLQTPAPNRDAWIGQAVAMVVIYRWYAPQLVEKYHAPYPSATEQAALQRLSATLPEWPRSITTE